jgi:hypothetical protein
MIYEYMVAGRGAGCDIAAAAKPKPYVKPDAAITVFELLMMDGVSPETC